LIAKLALFAALLAAASFFSSSESALFSLGLFRIRRLKKSAKRSLDAAQSLLTEPTKLISTLLIGNELVNTSLGVVGSVIVYELLHEQAEPKHLRWVAIALVLPFVLILGEIIPKTIGLRLAERVISVTAVPLHWFARMTAPLRDVLVWVPDRILGWAGGHHRPPHSVSEEVFRSMVDEGMEEGILDTQEQKMIHNVFRLDDVRVSAIMTPLGAVSSVWSDVTVEEVMRLFEADRFSRFPILARGGGGEVSGVLYAKDLLATEDLKRNEPVSKFARPALVVAPEINAMELFSQFRARRTHFAVVGSEKGAMIGVVTLDDVLEEVFGRIRDERDLEEGKPSKSS
jgi:putative hemolysin